MTAHRLFINWKSSLGINFRAVVVGFKFLIFRLSSRTYAIVDRFDSAVELSKVTLLFRYLFFLSIEFFWQINFFRKVWIGGLVLARNMLSALEFLLSLFVCTFHSIHIQCGCYTVIYVFLHFWFGPIFVTPFDLFDLSALCTRSDHLMCLCKMLRKKTFSNQIGDTT